MTHKAIKSLRLIHIAITVLLALATAAAYAYGSANVNPAGSSYYHFNYVVPLLFASIAFGAYRYSKVKLKSIILMDNLKQKLHDYRKLQIIQYGLIELACMVSLIAFLLTKELNYIIYASLIIIYLIYIRPNDFRLRSDLELDASSTDPEE